MVLQRVNALSFSSRVGLGTVWGDYWERSEDPAYVLYQEQTQELGDAANGNHAVYSGLDLGSGVDSVMLRVALASGSNSAEIRIGSVTGPLLGSCTIGSTGDATSYATVGCPVDPGLAKGSNKTIVIRFTGTNAGMRFNWFGFWARGTVQEIDKLNKIQSTAFVNSPSRTLDRAGTTARTRRQLPTSTDRLSRDYGTWTPSQAGDCPKWLHDSHWVRGDDGKVYATWHPATDFDSETGQYCSFGHEHGSDPRGSDVFTVSGMPPFGFVNENHEPDNVLLQRSEDHVGHKVMVLNNFTMNDPGGTAKKCDVMVKLHVGTHSPDALTNTAHEMLATGQCEGLQPFNVKQFTLFGPAGVFKEAETEGCGQYIQSVVAPMPPNQPAGGIHRSVPTRDCFLRGTRQDQLRLVEDRAGEFWLGDFFGGNFYYTIGTPSRYYDPAAGSAAGRVVDLCYDPTHPMARTQKCQETVAASAGRVLWNDARSSFRGTIHTNTHLSKLVFSNSPTSTVYTNAWGQGARATPDTAAGITLKQLVPTTAYVYSVAGQASRIPNVDHSGGGRNGVRAPN